MRQYTFETGNKETRRISRELRKAGYKIITSSLGNQITPLGLIKLIKGCYYKLKGFKGNKDGLLLYKGLFEGDYICDVCGHSHYNKFLPSLHWFIVNKDNWIKVGTTCIKKIILE